MGIVLEIIVWDGSRVGLDGAGVSGMAVESWRFVKQIFHCWSSEYLSSAFYDK